MLRKAWAVALAVLLLCAAPVLAQDRSVKWTRWDVRIDNFDTAANRFDVTEHYEVEFSGTFRFGTREIPHNGLEAIEAVGVFQNGERLREGCDGGAGAYCVETTADQTNITYNFFEPITDDSASFDLHYTIEGALRVHDAGDVLYWSAIPPEHFGFAIEQTRITVDLPSGFAPLHGEDSVRTYGAPTTIQVDGNQVIATATREIGGDETLEIYVQYPHDPNAQIPAWQSGDEEAQGYQTLASTLLFSLFVLLQSVIALFL